MQERSAHQNNLNRKSERGAALITMLLISIPLLMAGGALITITSMSVANNADTSAETKAYYAAEAGAQSVLNVMRGNDAPNSLTGIAAYDTMNFRNAITVAVSNVSGDTTVPRLSRWLSYDSTYTDRVTLTLGYSPLTGMAFKATLSDPDNSAVVTFSTSGGFNNYGMASSHQFGNGNTKATLTYQPQAVTTITGSGSSTLGAFAISGVGSNGYTLSNEPFTLTITQTAPWADTYAINCTLSGTITSSSSFVTVSFPSVTNNLAGTLYTRPANPLNTNGTTLMPVSITAPQPNRLVAKITGLGPRAAQKQLQMLLSRFAFDFSPVSTVTLRSADNGSNVSFNAGSSSQYTYTGFDNAGGQNLPAFGVTSGSDYTNVNGQISSNECTSSPSSCQISGTPAALQQVNLSSLPNWLQTADSTRALVNQFRAVAQATNDYYTTASPPPSFGTPSQPQFTFVDGDAALPPAGGAGLLVVTGTLTLNGSSQFDGLILVLGTGQLIRNGGGNGVTLGSIVVASFGNTGNFNAPTFNSNGSGTSDIKYDSDWVRRALATPGPRVTAIGEF